MAQERLLLSVLPLTVRSGSHHHLSLHVAPRLTPDTSEAALDSFAIFSGWASAARLATWRIKSGNSVIAATPLIEIIDADLWQRVFPGDTPVRGPRIDTFKGRTFRSFDARQAHDVAVATAVYSALLFPVDVPRLESFTGGRESIVERAIGAIGENDDYTTRLLDAGKWQSLGPLGPVLGALHPVRRFYERTELAREYKEGPVAGVSESPLDTPRPDFHERVAHLADQPQLLRRLGLVIDVRVDDLTALAAAAQLSAELVLDGVTASYPVTPVSRWGDMLLSKPRSGDWQSGRLKLGDASKYSTLALDTDGAALKLEAFVRSLPKMLEVSRNHDPGHAAPPAQRSEGFSVTRRGKANSVRSQLDAAETLVNAAASSPPFLATEDITRGFRVEVWDDKVQKWFSLHARRATATLHGEAEPVYSDLPEFGTVQTTAAVESPGVQDSPVYIHEALFGWSGWSLSAPRPGPRAVFEAGAEVVTEDQPDPVTPILVTTRVEPGSLPRLRYGRRYAFRAWSVDLAGNSPADLSNGGWPATPVAAAGPAGPAQPARSSMATVGETSVKMRMAAPVSHLANLAASVADAGLGGRSDPLRFEAANPSIVAPALTGDREIDRIVLKRLRETATAETFSAKDALASATRSAIGDVRLTPEPGERSKDLQRMVAADVHSIMDTGALKTADLTVTPLVPFLRWDPVSPPVVVARHRFSMAESNRHLVIRSGIALDPDGEPAVVPPDDYLAEVTGRDPLLAIDWREQSERHLTPPKGSQHLNELHGKFDSAIGQPATAASLLAAAFRDDGTLFDTEIVDLSDPTSTIPQPNVTLEAEPGADPAKLADVTGDKRGNPMPPGNYVVHDVDQLQLPYLPDPMARGVGLDMVGANVGSPLVGLYAIESTSVDYEGSWPEPEPLRLVLKGADTTNAAVEGNALLIALAPGTRVDLNLSSTLRPEELDLFALWNLFPEPLRKLELLRRAATDGQLWALTPQEPVSLVHAVPRPVQRPLISILMSLRGPADTGTNFIAALDLHGPSTGRIDVEAQWTEPVDDLGQPGPKEENRLAVACHADLQPYEDIVLLAPLATAPEIPGIGRVPVHKARHEFGDTKHRLVNYSVRASTRFREYFPEPLVDTADKRSLVSDAKPIHVLSSATPPPPVVHSVLPLFRWDEVGDPGQPFGIRRRRRSGIRIYLERPWFLTGVDEQLALLFPGAGTEPGYLSAWGGDPIWLNKGPLDQLVGIAVEDVYASTGLDGVRGPDPRLSPPASIAMADNRAGRPNVLGYRPEYNPDRQMWFVDVSIEPGQSVWPFVRLAIARYQPYSLAGRHLSRHVYADFVPLPPERELTVSRPDAGSVRVTVTGPLGLRQSILRQRSAPAAPVEDHSDAYPFAKADLTNIVAQDRRLIATIERRPLGIASDLAWIPVLTRELTVGGVSAGGEWAWTAILELPESLSLDTPGGDGSWRVLVEERESLEADPLDLDAGSPLTKQSRVIYADAVMI